MSTRTRRLLVALAAAAAAALASPLAAAAGSAHSARTERMARLARKGITNALHQGWIKGDDARRYRADVYLALRGIRFLPRLRGDALASQLSQVSRIWQGYTSPRALALFTQLEENVNYLRSHRIPASHTDVTGTDGVVYRWFPGLGLEFHPLANFGALNNDVAHRNEDATRLLASALVARGVPRGGSLLWEYSFPYGRGRPPWASGMAQAVAAQALARAGSLLHDRRLLDAARRAYEAIPGKLDFKVSTGPWIRLYGFDREIVLNAQLQAIVSLQDYGDAADDSRAQSLANQLLGATRGLLWRFDTGDWSRYELGGAYATHDYQVLVTQLLRKIAKRTDDPFWQDVSARFVNYTYEPPEITQTTSPEVSYPVPADGFHDTVDIPFTLSKRARVTMAVAGKILSWGKLDRGDHTVSWTPPPDVEPGTYNVTLRAVDFGGNKATAKLAPVTIAWDTAAPPLEAQADPATNMLTWQADDPGTPWLDLELELSDPTGVQAQQHIELGRQPTTGSLQLSIPAGTWYSAVYATNSAGKTTKVYLPALTGVGNVRPSPGSPPTPVP